MGGSGDGGFYSPRSPDELRAEVQRALGSRDEREIDQLLAEQLARINDRDVSLVNDRLDQMSRAIGEQLADFERLSFGGSVSKHTYVDGLSDIDSLVIIDAGDVSADTPAALRETVARALRDRLDHGKLVPKDPIVVGNLAVTVRFADGMEIQLLPALRRGDRLSISSKDGSSWSFIRPKAFTDRLTDANQRLGGRLVPTIKLVKSIVENLPQRDRPGGYHIEALAIDAFRTYDGPRDTRQLVTHLLNHASGRILRPIADVTGQSPRIDETLGAAESDARRRVSRALLRLARRAEQAQDAAAWREILGT